jgi:hypothetical protein
MNLRRLNYLLVLSVICAVALIACSSAPVKQEAPVAAAAPPPAPPPVVVQAAPPPPAMPAPVEIITESAPGRATLTVRDFIVPERSLGDDYFNLILFARKPVNKAERDLYITVCENWKATFPDAKEVNLKEVPKEFQIIPFYWMLRKFTVDTNSCGELVDWYDYTRAKVYLTTKKLKVAKNQIVCRLPSGFVVMDISTLKKSSDIEMAFKAWQLRMTVVPSKDGVVHIYTLKDSAIAVLGALGSLVTLKL